MLIKHADASDIDDIHRLLYRLADATGEISSYAGDMDALRKHGFGKHKLFHTLLAENNDMPVGLCTFFPLFSTWLCQPGLYVQDLYVDPDNRGNGLGRRLLCHAIRYAEEHWQASYLRLSVVKNNADARAFYRALGFTADDTYDHMLLTGDAFNLIQS